jgi:hypothetical protein
MRLTATQVKAGLRTLPIDKLRTVRNSTRLFMRNIQPMRQKTLWQGYTLANEMIDAEFKRRKIAS